MAAESRQQVFFALAEFSVDHDHGDSAVLASENGLADQVAVGRRLALGCTGSGEGRLLAHQHNDLALHVQAFVVVVLPFVGGDAVPDKR